MLAVIGGSGVYNVDGLRRPSWVKVESSFGSPSDEILVGELEGLDIAFLPRHAPLAARLRHGRIVAAGLPGNFARRQFDVHAISSSKEPPCASTT